MNARRCCPGLLVTLLFLGFFLGRAEAAPPVENQSPKKAARARHGGPGYAPPVDKVDHNDLRELIGEMRRLHGEEYPKAQEHLARLERLHDGDKQLVDLQREVLLFDVDKLLVIQRHEIQASHVYTYLFGCNRRRAPSLGYVDCLD